VIRANPGATAAPISTEPAIRSRAGSTQYVLADGDRWTLHRSQWGASAILTDVVAGPGFAERRIARRCPGDWLSEAECEAGLLIDRRRKVLLFFGAHQQVLQLDLRAALFEVLRRSWPGWTVLWAYGGLADLRTYVGAERRRDSAAPPPAADRRAFPAARRCYRPPWWSEAIGTLVTVQHTAGTVLVHVLADELTPLWQGPALVGRMPPGVPHLDAPAWPACGLHLDLGRRAVSLWTASTFPGGRSARFRSLWSGWDVTFWRDRIADHLAVAGGAVRTPPVPLPAGAVRLAHVLRDAWAEPVTSPDVAWLGGLTPVVGPVITDGVSAQALAEDPLAPSAAERRAVFGTLRAIAESAP
jgi:hypothetical protein